MCAKIDYQGMPHEWFPMKPRLRSFLESISSDHLQPTPKPRNISKALQSLLGRKWVACAYDPEAGKQGMLMCSQTPLGKRALEIDDQVKQGAVIDHDEWNSASDD